MKKLMVIICAVVAVFGMTSCKSSSPSDTVNAYFKALQACDYEKALSYTDIADPEEVQKQVEKFKTYEVKVVDFEVLSETISEDGGSAEVEVKSTQTSAFNSNPQEDTKKMSLVKVDGKWKIHV
jgi:hypothetical protein